MYTTEDTDDRVLQPCGECGALNRIPRARLVDDPTCGACKRKVFPRRTIAVTDDSWQRLVEQSAVPVLVDFWAPWCGPCRAVAPAFEQIARERAGRVVVLKLHTDDNPRTASRFGIRSIPTMMLFAGGRVVAQEMGARPKPALDAWLDRYL